MNDTPTSRTTLPGYWFSQNPDKAWGEKFFLAYLPYFFALNYSKQLMGWMNVGTFWHITQNLALLLPLIAIPAVLRPAVTGRAWWDNYAVKMVLWMFVYNFFVTYFGCEYFFDVLGMVYYFPQVSFPWIRRSSAAASRSYRSGCISTRRLSSSCITRLRC